MALQKLVCRFYDPYLIEQKISPVAYKLQLPSNSRIHPVFHISLLKKKIGDATFPTKDLSATTDKGNIILQPDFILDTRWIKRGGKIIEENLVKWKQLPAEEATWKLAQNLAEQFPNLEDKVTLDGGGDDKIRRSQRKVKQNPRYLDN